MKGPRYSGIAPFCPPGAGEGNKFARTTTTNEGMFMTIQASLGFLFPALRRLTFFSVVASVVPMGILAQTAAKPGETTIELRALEAETQKPLVDLVVSTPFSVQSPNPGNLTSTNTLRTDSEGKVRLTIPASAPTPLTYLPVTFQSSNRPPFFVTWSSTTQSDIRSQLPATHTIHLKSPLTIGGWVRDAKGEGVAGAEVLVWGFDYDQTMQQQTGVHRDERHQLPPDRQRAVQTDANGRWQFHLFPTDLSSINLEANRPQGGITRFQTPNVRNFGGPKAKPLALTDLLATNAVLTLDNGSEVKGFITDTQGRPLAGAMIQEQVGMDLTLLPAPVTNRNDGHFTLPDRSYKRALLHVQAPGYALSLVPVEPGRGNPEHLIRLEPAKPLKIQVLDADGKPLEGANVMVAGHRSEVMVNWSGTTDSTGWATWTNAPFRELVLWVNSGKGGGNRAIRMKSSDRQGTVKLPRDSNPAVTFKIRAIDAASRKPIPSFTVKRSQYVGMAPTVWGEAQNGEFLAQFGAAGENGGMEPMAIVHVEASGYMLWKSELLYADEGDREITAELSEAKPLSGDVLTPDGQPAGKAMLLLGTQEWGLYSWQPGKFDASQGGIVSRTDETGKFTLTPYPEDRWVVITHSAGFAAVKLSALKQNPKIQLEKWARVEGILLIGGQPAKSMSVSVRTPITREGSIAYHASYSQSTKADGSFVFTNLPPGGYVFYRQPMVLMGRAVVESHPVPFDLKPGETHRLEFPPNGRTVEGSLMSQNDVDWLNDLHVLQLKLGELPEPPNYYEYTSVREFEAAQKAYQGSPAATARWRAARQYQLEMDSSGAFKVTDVPPGTYVLTVKVTRPPAPGQHWQFNAEILGSLEKEIVIPAGKEPLDLGPIDVNVKGETAASTGPLNLSMLSLDGKALSLESLRGKPIVLTFWANWTLSGLDHLRALEAVRKESKDTEGVIFLAVNLDEELADAQLAQPVLGQNWVQTRLSHEARLAAAEATKLETLPRTLLLDSNGRMIGREMVPARLNKRLAQFRKPMASK